MLHHNFGCEDIARGCRDSVNSRPSSRSSRNSSMLGAAWALHKCHPLFSATRHGTAVPWRSDPPLWPKLSGSDKSTPKCCQIQEAAWKLQRAASTKMLGKTESLCVRLAKHKRRRFTLPLTLKVGSSASRNEPANTPHVERCFLGRDSSARSGRRPPSRLHQDLHPSIMAAVEFLQIR